MAHVLLVETLMSDGNVLVTRSQWPDHEWRDLWPEVRDARRELALQWAAREVESRGLAPIGSPVILRELDEDERPWPD